MSAQRLALEHFKNTASAHATTNAHGDCHTLGPTAFAFDQGVACETLTAHTVRVTHGNGATVDVEAIGWNAQSIAALQNLHGKGFVQFPQIDVGYFEAQTRQCFGHCVNGTNAHFVRFATCYGKAQEAAQWFQTTLLG